MSTQDARRRHNGADEDLILELWERLPEEKRELLLPRLIRESRLGTKLLPANVPWRPSYGRF
jgi:hypothetical protein